MKINFADRLIDKIKEKGTPICVGLDPRLDKIPGFLIEQARQDTDKSPLKQASDAILEFNKGIIDAVYDIVPVVKPQIAFYEVFGAAGINAYIETLKYAKSKGLITIADAKRNDIGSTAEAYARAFLGEVVLFEGKDEIIQPIFDADSVTINAYLGWDGIKPFVEEAERYGKGFFALVKTSNPSSGDIQDLEMKDGKPVYEIMGSLLDSFGADHIGERGYSFAGAVIGATYPEQAKKLRALMPNTFFLVPGYGAQGGGAKDVKPCFDKNGTGAIVNSSRGIIYAYEKLEGYTPREYDKAAREAALQMKKDLETVL